jgi:hypothetical protein
MIYSVKSALMHLSIWKRLQKGDMMNTDEFRIYFEKRNKAFKRDVNLFIFIIAWGVPLSCWCVAQVINGLT